MRERRRFRRYEVTQFAKYKKVSSYMGISSLATIKNISLGGLCAILSRIVERGDKISIELYLPYNKKLNTLAKVVWTKPLANTGGKICGVKFLEVSSLPLLMGYIAYARKISQPYLQGNT